MSCATRWRPHRRSWRNWSACAAAFLCYTPVVAPPPVTPLPAAENGFVTFGSFNALAKITQEVRASRSLNPIAKGLGTGLQKRL